PMRETVFMGFSFERVRGGPGSWPPRRPGQSGGGKGHPQGERGHGNVSAEAWSPLATLAPAAAGSTLRGRETRSRPVDTEREAPVHRRQTLGRASADTVLRGRRGLGRGLVRLVAGGAVGVRLAVRIEGDRLLAVGAGVGGLDPVL